MYYGRHSHRHFNPLHREGGDESIQAPSSALQISIHSTARVETTSRRTRTRLPAEFQSTPPRGWRPYISAVSSWLQGLFQSTPPRGWRLHVVLIRRTTASFQSTPPRGWRLSRTGINESEREFQSTPPRGWRHLKDAGYIEFTNLFQSTPPRGWRPLRQLGRPAGAAISIHSTARVETLHLLEQLHLPEKFQSTPPRGWRHLCRHAPVWG